jgi:hypothetical protein
MKTRILTPDIKSEMLIRARRMARRNEFVDTVRTPATVLGYIIIYVFLAVALVLGL